MSAIDPGTKVVYIALSRPSFPYIIRQLMVTQSFLQLFSSFKVHNFKLIII